MSNLTPEEEAAAQRVEKSAARIVAHLEECGGDYDLRYSASIRRAADALALALADVWDDGHVEPFENMTVSLVIEDSIKQAGEAPDAIAGAFGKLAIQ